MVTDKKEVNVMYKHSAMAECVQSRLNGNVKDAKFVEVLPNLQFTASRLDVTKLGLKVAIYTSNEKILYNHKVAFDIDADIDVIVNKIMSDYNKACNNARELKHFKHMQPKVILSTSSEHISVEKPKTTPLMEQQNKLAETVTNMIFKTETKLKYFSLEPMAVVLMQGSHVVRFYFHLSFEHQNGKKLNNESIFIESTVKAEGLYNHVSSFYTN